MVFRGFIFLASRPFSSFFSLPTDFLCDFSNDRVKFPRRFLAIPHFPRVFSLSFVFSSLARFFSFRPRSLASRVFSFHPFSFLRSLFLSVRMKEARSLSTPDPIAPLVLFMPSLFLIKFSAFQSKKLFPYKMLSACAFQRRFFFSSFFSPAVLFMQNASLQRFQDSLFPAETSALATEEKIPLQTLDRQSPREI